MQDIEKVLGVFTKTPESIFWVSQSTYLVIIVYNTYDVTQTQPIPAVLKKM